MTSKKSENKGVFSNLMLSRKGQSFSLYVEAAAFCDCQGPGVCPVHPSLPAHHPSLSLRAAVLLSLGALYTPASIIISPKQGTVMHAAALPNDKPSPHLHSGASWDVVLSEHFLT